MRRAEQHIPAFLRSLLAPPAALACCQPCTGSAPPLIYGYFSFLTSAPAQAVSKLSCVKHWQRGVFGVLQGARDQADPEHPGAAGTVQEERGKEAP